MNRKGFESIIWNSAWYIVFALATIIFFILLVFVRKHDLVAEEKFTQIDATTKLQAWLEQPVEGQRPVIDVLSRFAYYKDNSKYENMVEASAISMFSDEKWRVQIIGVPDPQGTKTRTYSLASKNCPDNDGDVIAQQDVPLYGGETGTVQYVVCS
ncbi:MAG: hypothetical protein ABIA93_02835 [Candidatus Woesearchaeota archaeon]